MKKVLSVFIICLTIFFSFGTTYAAAANDEAVISSQDGNYIPLYTKSPDSSLKSHNSMNIRSDDYALFYTQTTFLALVAGYLILFKVKGLKHGEKMHGSKRSKLG